MTTEVADAAALLRSVPLMAGLPEDELENLAALSAPFALRSGHVLFEEGDPAEAVFVIGSGEIEAVKRLPGDRALAAARLGRGTMLGEMAMIAGVPRVATARAVADTAGIALDARAVQRLVAGAHPAAGELVYRVGQQALQLLRELVERTAETLGHDHRATQPMRALKPAGGEVTPIAPASDEVDYLRTILFFNRFTEAQLRELFGDLRRLAAPRGTELVAEGERPEALLFVLRGAVEATVHHGRAAARVRLSGPGRCVTHLGVLDGAPCP
ncbi:MAG TPA: cyclic nucleotide-binding domain-containing protein, partial [Solirubrobacteraceae bacterium]|nr:cyclic nucleotide-binding domain-containing protein [Solirubrobacteraceae bacterium]